MAKCCNITPQHFICDPTTSDSAVKINVRQLLGLVPPKNKWVIELRVQVQNCWHPPGFRKRECRFGCLSGLNRTAGGVELSQLWDNCYQCAIRPGAAASPARPSSNSAKLIKIWRPPWHLGSSGLLRPRQWQIFTFMHNVLFSEYNSLASPFLYKQHHATSIFCQNVEDDWTVLVFLQQYISFYDDYLGDRHTTGLHHTSLATLWPQTDKTSLVSIIEKETGKEDKWECLD